MCIYTMTDQNLQHLEKGDLYGFTYKMVAGKAEDVNQRSYDSVLKRLKAKGGVIISRYYEQDSHGRLHVHGIVQLEKNPFFKSLRERGIASKFEQIYNLEGWEKYITKQQRVAHDYGYDERSHVKRGTSLFNRKELLQIPDVTQPEGGR